MLLAITVVCVVIMAYVYSSKALSSDSKRTSNKRISNSYQPYSSLAILIAGGYLLIYNYLAVALLLLSVLLSIAITLVHASMRLRNLKNKITNKMETVRTKKTPMAIMLNVINVQSEDFLN